MTEADSLVDLVQSRADVRVKPGRNIQAAQTKGTLECLIDNVGGGLAEQDCQYKSCQAQARGISGPRISKYSPI